MSTSREDRQRSTERAYDRVASDFAERTADRSPMATSFFERFLSELPTGALVADLGCGPGHDLRRLIEAGYDAIGIDRAAGLLSLGPAGASPVRSDLRTLPFGTDSIHGLWSSAALLHVDVVDLHDTFNEWARALAGGAVLGFATSLAEQDRDQGWELVPAGPNRRPDLPGGEQRWFVHHRHDDLFEALVAADFNVTWHEVRSSHRDWLQVIAIRGAESAAGLAT